MPNSKKTKPAPAAKSHAAKSSKPAPVKKPATQPKPVSHPKPAAAKPKAAAAKPAPAKPAPAKHHQPVKAHVPSSHKPAHKPVPEKKAPAAKAPEPLKPVAKVPAKPLPPAKPAPAAKTIPVAKPVPVPTTKPSAGAAKAAGKAAAKADALRARILERRTAKPIAFTLDEVREIAKVNVPRSDEKNGLAANGAASKAKAMADEIEARLKKAAQPHFVKAASLADILGYNPAKQAAPTVLSAAEIDPKFQRYYKLLIELREHVASGLDTHTEQTLKRSAKDDSGDLSGYAQHMADAGTDTFDRDFALSLVSNEQEALAEVEAAIQRIKLGTYGVCELTGKPINKDRLLAVPFARFSVESQTEVERTKRRSAHRAGLFGEGEEGGKMEDDGGGGDE
ncbi:MAG: TraR/DksA C4-type zinc finger protein [Opitutaceae bacterium]|nr:TraR/DksA C4-type zinc finger protein [Opitutaceae bacterium]